VDPKPLEARFERKFDTFRLVIVVPELRSDEEIFAPHPSLLQHPLDCFAYRFFVAIPLRAIKLAKAGFQSSSGRTPRVAKIRDQGAKPKGRNGSSVVHWNSSGTKFVLFGHRSSR